MKARLLDAWGSGQRRPRIAFWFAFVLFSSMAGFSAIASPLASGPDEASHVARAAGLARGHLMGSEDLPGIHTLELPRLYELNYTLNDCFGLRPDVPASCVPPVAGNLTEMVESKTTAGRYNPLYYTVLAPITLLPPGIEVLYLVRLASLLLCSLALALGVRTLAEMRAPSWPVAGTVVAVTPMVVYLGGVVNPASVEAAAGVSLWVVLLAALREPDPHLVRRRMLRAGFLVALLVNAKALSPLLLALIVSLAVLAGGWKATRRLLTDRRSWPGLALGVVASGLAVLWIAIVGTVGQAEDGVWAILDPATAGNLVARRTSAYLMNMIGVFGTVDAVMPTWAYIWFGACAGVLVLLAFACGTVRERLAVIGGAVATLALPAILQIPRATTLGLPWQGRYLLPLAVGLPILAGFICQRHLRDLPQNIAVRISGVLITGMAFLHFVGFATNLRRHVAGASAEYFRPVPNPWEPPVNAWVLVSLMLLTLVAFVAFFRAVARDGTDRADDVDTCGPTPSVAGL